MLDFTIIYRFNLISLIKHLEKHLSKKLINQSLTLKFSRWLVTLTLDKILILQTHEKGRGLN